MSSQVFEYPFDRLVGLSQSAVDNLDVKMTGIVVASASTMLLVSAFVGGILILRRISSSVGLAKPTVKQLQEEAASLNCALFRHLPQLSDQLAWRSLGAAPTTPIHVCSLPSRNNDKKILTFFVKREDLINTKRYGGNKVRTLQHQLAVLEARRDRGDVAAKHIAPLGSGGSNQVIATAVHAQPLGWKNTKQSNDSAAIHACWFDVDEPDFDNTLNFLSVLSMPNVASTFDWGMSPGVLKTLGGIAGAVRQREFIPLMLGGNCTAGVLGQVSGVLELAEQIVRGDSPDIDRIYVPIGSACTVSGLILGTVLVRHLQIKALSNPNFQIVGCNTVDSFALMDRMLGMHLSPLFSFIPMTIQHSVLETCHAMKQLGGPDLTSECKQFMKHNVQVRSSEEVVGKYGAHTDKTREAALHYDEFGTIKDYKTAKQEKELWVCGHFVAKAFQPLIEDLEEANKDGMFPKYMLWQTKSAIQPRGTENEWAKMSTQDDTVKEWADKGKAESMKFRPGTVSTLNGKPEDYRSVMTVISME